MIIEELAAIAREYMQAVEALHTTHGSTDVHGNGGIAGQAITDHCAWTCHVLEARIDPETLKMIGNPHRFVHQDALDRYEAASRSLGEALGVSVVSG